MEKSFDSLSERMTVAEKLLKYLEESGSEIKSRKRNRYSVGKMVEIEHLGKSLEKRLEDLEKRKKGYDTFKERRKRKLSSEEEELNLKRGKFVNDVKMRKEVLNEDLVMVTEHDESMGVAQAEVQNIHRRACKKLEEIESQEQNLRRAHESLAERERKVDIIIGTLDERINAVEEREKEFNCFLEGKMREMVLKEEKLGVKWEGFVEQVKLVDERLRKQVKLKYVDGIVERLEFAEKKLEGMRENLYERLKEIECRENAAWESLELSVKESDLIRESMEKQVEEFEKIRSEFSSFQEEKMRELGSKEQLLNEMSEKVIKDAKLRDDQLITRVRSVNQLLKRLELAKDNVEGLKDVIDERFKTVALKEIDVNSTIDWVERRMDEADSKANELKVKKKRIKIMEDNVIYKENELREKEKELDLMEQAVQAWQKELEVKQREVDSAQEFNEQRLKKLDARENSVRELMRNCFKEHQDIKKKLLLEKDLVEKVAIFIGLKEENLKHATRELEFSEKLMGDHFEELELIHQRSTDNFNAHVRIKPDESVDLKFTVRMDGKNLQMFLNDPVKDLESMGDEIFKVLHLSLDPAKLVLDAMVGFYPPHLRKGDMALDVRRTCIALLKQLMKMTKKIKPCVREEAMELAFAWKLKMRATAENPSLLEVLGFFFLLAAYDLASCFDKDDIFTLPMMVALHRETPELYSLLASAET